MHTRRDVHSVPCDCFQDSKAYIESYPLKRRMYNSVRTHVHVYSDCKSVNGVMKASLMSHMYIHVFVSDLIERTMQAFITQKTQMGYETIIDEGMLTNSYCLYTFTCMYTCTYTPHMHTYTCTHTHAHSGRLIFNIGYLHCVRRWLQC